MQEADEVAGPENAAVLSDLLHLLVENCAGRVTCEDEECADGAVAGVEAFVETAGCSKILLNTEVLK